MSDESDQKENSTLQNNEIISLQKYEQSTENSANTRSNETLDDGYKQDFSILKNAQSNNINETQSQAVSNQNNNLISEFTDALEKPSINNRVDEIQGSIDQALSNLKTEIASENLNKQKQNDTEFTSNQNESQFGKKPTTLYCNFSRKRGIVPLREKLWLRSNGLNTLPVS